MKRRKRANRCRLYNILDSRAKNNDLGGSSFVMHPALDPIAWQALVFYASITPNAAQRQALREWLHEHPCPGAPVIEQMEMTL